jgi:hypothetical protein
MARRCVIGGDPPGPAARGRGQPHVIVGDEGDEVTVDVRESEIAG